MDGRFVVTCIIYGVAFSQSERKPEIWKGRLIQEMEKILVLASYRDYEGRCKNQFDEIRFDFCCIGENPADVAVDSWKISLNTKHHQNRQRIV
jgi:hypothetical protein